MTLEEFVKKWNGKKCDFDGVYGCQCVDLFRQYCREVLAIPEHTGSCSTSGGAKDLYIDYNKMPKEKKYFSRSSMKNYREGDVLIWNSTETNRYGHVAVFVSKLGELLLVFEQDGFKQDGAKLNIRSRENILGYLRKK